MPELLLSAHVDFSCLCHEIVSQSRHVRKSKEEYLLITYRHASGSSNGVDGLQ